MCGLTIGGHPITDDASRSNWWKLVTRRILRTSALMLSQSRTAPAPGHEAYAPRWTAQCCHLDRARMRHSSWVRIACAVSALRCRFRRKPANISTDAHRAVYFAMPDPFELLPCWSNGLTGTLPCEARACWLSLPARIFRSFVRPLTSRSENSRASIDEIARVSDGGIDQRLQARRIKRKNTRGFLILHPTRKPPYERSVRRVSQDRSSADCP